jgi:hypothetical protein
MNKKELMIAGFAVAITLVFANKLRSLPLVSKLPTA